VERPSFATAYIVQWLFMVEFGRAELQLKIGRIHHGRCPDFLK
jgi:hypothetical protein